MCVDYRALNAKTRRDCTPLPRIDESMDLLIGSKWFSTMDLQSAYCQIEIREEDKYKSAFTTPFGLFEFNRMSFGLINGPATMQKTMYQNFQDEIMKTMIVYLDDIISFSHTISEHLQLLGVIFQRLESICLKLEMKKCEFFKRKVKFLGFIVSENGVSTDEEKVQAVRDWETPTTVKQLRQFIGFCSYYRKFVNNFAQEAKVLHEVISRCEGIKREKRKKGTISILHQWTEECNNAFLRLKKGLTTAPCLAFADYGFRSLLRQMLQTMA